MKPAKQSKRSGGFTIVEVMVSLIVISVGLLGIAKMQALALSSTSISRQRSLAAIEAASLASAMHANRGYWAKATLVDPISVTGGAATTTESALTTALGVAAGTADYCTTAAKGAPCAPVTMAGVDLNAWAKELNAMLPNSTATIACPTTNTPLSCTIVITWSEKAVAINAQAAGSAVTAGAFQLPTYRLYVEP